MENRKDVVKKLIDHVELFQRHPHPVVHVLMKGFSKVLVRQVFPAKARLENPGRTMPNEFRNAC